MADFGGSGGYDPALDFFLPTRPENPLMRDSASFWVSDDAGRFGFPRMTIEAIAGVWDNRGVEANIAFPDGRVLIGAGAFPPSPARTAGGKTVTLNAGPLTFEIIEPLKHWKMTFDGAAYETTAQKQIAGETTGPMRQVRIEIDAVMAAPPWSPGEQSQDQSTALAVGAIGGHRHEQLFVCTGVFQVEGEAAMDFAGRGLRVRRYGHRDVGEFPGHCWQSAVFPSGRAFGSLAFPPRKDGTPAYNDAFVFENGRKVYAKVVEAPWMTTIVPHGGACDVVLETSEGRRITIEGRTHDTTYITEGNPMFGNWTPGGVVKLPFHQGGAHYTWDGESAYGMIERSLPLEQMKA